MSETVLARAGASAPRRWMGVAVLALLGGLLVYLALTAPASLGWQAFLLVLGGAALFLATRMHQTSAVVLELTETELRESDGEVIATIEDIKRLNRGALAVKPSNGFTLQLDRAGKGRWIPGIWWRWGKRVGIGGIMPAADTKTMAQMIEQLLAEQAGDAP